MTVLITCGGTGGHIYPALSIASHIKEKVIFVGTSKRMESKLIPQNGYDFITIPSSRKNPIKIIISIIKSIFIIIKTNPNYIITTGGYVTLPVCLSGLLLKKKIILQEQNTIPGKVNRVVAKFAYKIALGFPLKKNIFPVHKCIITGNPVRELFLKSDKQLKNNSFEVLVIGGSQGARNINNNIISYFESTTDKIAITLLSGEKLYKECSNTIKRSNTIKTIFNTQNTIKNVNNNGAELTILPYSNDIVKLMSKADLIIARAGASTLSEITALKKASILIPYPYAAENHQFFNAELFTSKEAAFAINDDELSADSINAIITRLKHDPVLLEQTSENAGNFYKKNAALTIANWTTE